MFECIYWAMCSHGEGYVVAYHTELTDLQECAACVQ
jgi:hypothetical protein